jgi:hypothetical protein
MRTVTFADEKLVREISRSFVPVWHNQDPEGAAGGNCAAAKQPAPAEANEYPLGAGGANLRTYICSPEGKLVYFLEGYWSPETYLAELRAALAVYERSKRADGKVSTNEIVLGIKAHSDEIEKLCAAMRHDFPDEFTKPIKESKVRREHAALNLKLKSYVTGINMAGKDVLSALTESIRHNVMRGAMI